ncbi:pleckstrin homology domain-containing family O member 2 isoform X2 [Syngnathoides biaculeatus]|uniref:pleckstrin homology domain-containing family O member 2 isoform X2 n=1 Tax=Syngnathoides biaculeatus TaxID=300417 RepID=UPI002ADD85ED|nr:pleckstrin homology domain-containing family O member 2 isoform X2 [Syngnathoides biaculeatus]
MENATREEQAQCNNPKFLGKAGWVKKAPCRLLASYKDSYILVDKTCVLVYENEELKNCIESLDLENYDKCHELKNLFMRKHRLILIRSPKSGSKIHNIKFQVQTAEEKEAWIEALSDGINRAKNKVLDEVKMDESSNLQHITRTRPKGNHHRRPPTRIHLKEVAELSCEGLQRLDLELLDAAVANGTYGANVDVTDMPRETNKSSVLECNFTETAENSHAKSQSGSKIIKLPVERQEKAAWKNTSLLSTSPDPPGGASSELAGNSQLKRHTQPPTPPTKDKKPSCCPSEPNQETKCAPDSDKNKQQVQQNNPRVPQKEYETLPCVGDDTTLVSEDEKTKRESPNFNIQAIEDDKTGSQEGEDHNSCLGRPVLFTSICSDVLPNDSTTPSEMFLPTTQEKTNADKECLNSRQHLNAKSKASACENAFTSTTALGGNDTGTHMLNTCSCDTLLTPIVTATTHVGSNVAIYRHPEAMHLSTNIRSVSFGDLLSDSTIISLQCHSEAITRNDVLSVDVIKLENELTLEMDKTNQLMNSVCSSNMRRHEECTPGDLLTMAMEKLKRADCVLKEVKKLKCTKSLRKRNSW